MTIVGQEDLVVAGSPKATDLIAGGNATGQSPYAGGVKDRSRGLSLRNPRLLL
jgi:hypothetical protein